MKCFKKKQSIYQKYTYDILLKEIQNLNIKDIDFNIFIDTSYKDIDIKHISKDYITDKIIFILDIINKFKSIIPETTTTVHTYNNKEIYESPYVEDCILAYKTIIYDNKLNKSNDSNSYLNITNHIIEKIQRTRKYTIIFIITQSGISKDNIEDNVKSIWSLTHYPASIINIGLNNQDYINLIGIDHMNLNKIGGDKNITRTQKRKKRIFDNFTFVNYNNIIKRPIISERLKEELFTKLFCKMTIQYQKITTSEILKHKLDIITYKDVHQMSSPPKIARLTKSDSDIASHSFDLQYKTMSEKSDNSLSNKNNHTQSINIDIPTYIASKNTSKSLDKITEEHTTSSKSFNSNNSSIPPMPPLEEIHIIY